RPMQAVAAASAIGGLAALSVAPHQEARFLLPALPGLAIWCAPTASGLRRRGWWWALWIGFNAVLFAVFGVVHQAGVVPVVAHLSRSVWPHAQCHAILGSDHAVCVSADADAAADRPPLRLTTTVLLASTYMAPRHLLAQSAAAHARVELVDLVGFSHEQIRGRISASVLVDQSLGQHNQTTSLTMLVVPGSVNIKLFEGHWRLVPVFSYAPHVNFDHMAETLKHPLKSSRLSLYLIASSK
ncbi:alpha 1,2 mannosyltransferase, partial [Coemansia aciculifera]